ncbi:hypothetical protein [Epilithonimonas sp. UC225_85]|uniref:hypothetical protein n=1 Tax=Epilithonimonas sp. UC225_85 TaxID=3350167 RepID=UPI0036D3D27C
MKKFLPLLLLLISSIFILSCKDDDDDYVDNDTYSAVYDLTVNMTYDVNSQQATYNQAFNRPMFDSDVVLVYRQTGTDNGNTVWQPLPQTLYNITAGNTTNNELDYTFDFTKNDFQLYASGTYNLTLTPSYITGQRFRIVLVPADFGKNANSVDPKTLSYEEVIKKYNIDDTKVKTL